MPCCESRLFPSGSESPVDATSTTVVVGLVDQACVTKVIQTFKSPKAVKDATIRFPLNNGATVTEFTATINGQVRTGVVKPKETARREYDQAVSAGQSAQLLASKATDLFELSLGNIEANADLIISFTYTAETQFSNGSLVTHLPLFSGPRYGESHRANEEDGSLSSVAASGGAVSISVTGHFAGGVQEIVSVNHNVAIVNGDQSETTSFKASQPCVLGGASDFNLVLTLSPTAPSKADFVLKIMPTKPFEASAVCETDPVTGNQAVMMSIMPDLPADLVGGVDGNNTDVTFVVDVSGSMSVDDRLPKAKEALTIFLNSLLLGMTFQIISFSNAFELFNATGQVLLTEANEDFERQRAMNFVNNLAADGGTELGKPVKAITESSPPAGNRRRNVVVLTDGDTDNTAEVLRMISKTAGSIRWFSIGLGSGASHGLCDGIAQNGNGTSSYASGGTLNDVVMNIFNQLTQPSHWWTIDWASGFLSDSAASAAAPQASSSSSSSAGKSVSVTASDFFSSVASAVSSAASSAVKAVTTMVHPQNSAAPSHATPVPAGLHVSPDRQRIGFTRLRETAYAVIDKAAGKWIGRSIDVHLKLANGQLFSFAVPVSNISGNAINALAAHAVILDIEAHDGSKTNVRDIALSRGIVSSETSMVIVGPDAATTTQATIRSLNEPPEILEGCVLSSNARCFGIPKSRQTKGAKSLRSRGWIAMGAPRNECAFRGDDEKDESAMSTDSDDSEIESKRPKAATTGARKPSIASILYVNKRGLWTFTDVVTFLPPEVRVWEPDQKASNLWSTIAVLKLLQSDYANDAAVWTAIAKRAITAIQNGWTVAEIAAVEEALAFSLTTL